MLSCRGAPDFTKWDWFRRSKHLAKGPCTVATFFHKPRSTSTRLMKHGRFVLKPTIRENRDIFHSSRTRCFTS
jgi:hypothetical protein